MTNTQITEKGILIKINESYKPDISAEELYEATRGIWRLGVRRENADYAFAIYKYEIIEVYKIDSWHPGGTTNYNIRTFLNGVSTKRKEFIGRLAEPEIRNKYIGENISNYYKRGEISPIKYINI